MECWTQALRTRNHCNDHGFMGFTHALSGLAAMAAILAFAPTSLVSTLGTGSVAILTLAFLGSVLSLFFRWSSKILQTVIRTRRDDPDPNPHRGVWHTPFLAAVVSYLVYLATKASSMVNVPGVGKLTYGVLFAWFLSTVLVILTASTLLKKQTDKMKKTPIVGAVMLVALCAVGTGSLIISSGVTDFRWLGISLFAGMLIHDIGDAFTTYGDPLFFPLSAILFGKFWWTTRFTKMEAGGDAEKWLVTGILMLVILVSVGHMAWFGVPQLK